MVLLAVAVLGGVLAAFLATRADGETAAPYVVRQVITDQVTSARNNFTRLNENWTYVNAQGLPEAFVGLSYTPSGEVTQARYIDADGERVYWRSFPPTGDSCVERRFRSAGWVLPRTCPRSR